MKCADRQREVGKLRKRLNLVDEKSFQAERLLVDNEVLLTALDEAASALADSGRYPRHAQLDAETAIAELERLVRLAG